MSISYQLPTVGKGFDYEKVVSMNKACLCYFGFLTQLPLLENDFKQTVDGSTLTTLPPVLSPSCCAQPAALHTTSVILILVVNL